MDQGAIELLHELLEQFCIKYDLCLYEVEKQKINDILDLIENEYL